MHSSTQEERDRDVKFALMSMKMYAEQRDQARSERDDALARVAQLEGERTEIVDACGFGHDDDPEAPKTLPEYVRETQKFAVRSMEEWTSDYTEAAVRRLSRHSKHIGEENERLRPRVVELEAELEEISNGPLLVVESCRRCDSPYAPIIDGVRYHCRGCGHWIDEIADQNGEAQSNG